VPWVNAGLTQGLDLVRGTLLQAFGPQTVGGREASDGMQPAASFTLADMFGCGSSFVRAKSTF
jgi:hypothetical protein